MKLHIPQSLMALLLTAYACLGEQWARPVYELTGNTITVSGNVTYPALDPIEYEDEHGYYWIWNEIFCTAAGNVTVTGNGVISCSVPWDDDRGLYFYFQDGATSILLDEGVTFRNVRIESGCGGFDDSIRTMTLKGTYYACNLYVPAGTVDLTQAKLLAYNGNACKTTMYGGVVFKVSNLVVSPNTTYLETDLGAYEGATIQGNLKLQGALPRYTTSGVLESTGCGINFDMGYTRYEDSPLCPMAITGNLAATADTPVTFCLSDGRSVLPSPEDDIFVCGSVDVSQLYHLKPYISTDYYGDDSYTLQPYDGHFEAERGVDGLMHIHLVSESNPNPAQEICFTRGGIWMLGENGYVDGNRVRFTNSGTVTVIGSVNPSAMTVDGSGNITWSGIGSVAGNGALTKNGSGKLTINTANSYTGGTVLNGGTLVAGSSTAFGTGDIQINAGNLDLDGNAIGNNISISRADTLIRNGQVIGDLEMADGSLEMANAAVSGNRVSISRASAVNVHNIQNDVGSAIYGGKAVDIAGNGSVSFSTNWAQANGGAINGWNTASISLRGNTSVEFSDNAAQQQGGAVYGADIAITGNGSVVFRGNSAAGEQHSSDDIITLNDFRKGKKEFHIMGLAESVIVPEYNLPQADGALENSAYCKGYANFAGLECDCTFMYRTDELYHESGEPAMGWLYITFDSLDATSSPSTLASLGQDPQGSDLVGSAVEIQFNFSIMECQVLSSTQGTVTINYPDPMGEYITFNAWVRSVLNANFYVTQRGASLLMLAASNGMDDTTPLLYGGGAVYVPQGGSVRIEGNNHVEFRNNWMSSGDTYRLMGLCVEGHELVLAAGEGQDITFHDALYAKSANGALQVSFNADYRDKGNVQREATGDIVFSGKYAEQDLRALKRYYTQEELEASRTTEVYGTTNLYGGRLRIEDGAVYKGEGINVAGGSKATLRLADGTLNQAGYAVTLASGTTLELQGVNNITAATLDMLSGSTLSFVLGSENLNASCLYLDGDLTCGGRITLNLSNNGTMKAGQEYRLLTMGNDSPPSSWNWNYVTIGGMYTERNDLRWQAGTLYYTYTRAPEEINFPAGGSWSNSSGEYADGDRVTFTDCGTITVVGTVKPGAMTVDGSGNTTWSGSGSVAGNSALTKDGSGTLTINTSNSFSGGTVIKQGTVSAGANNALGTGAVTMREGTTLKLNGRNLGQSDVTVAGNATLAAGSGGQVKSLTVSTKGGAQGQQGELLFAEKLALSGTLKTGTLTLEKGNIEGGSITVTGAATVEQGYLGSNISGKTLEKTGDKRVELKGANSFSGGVTVSGGQLALLEGGSFSGNVSVKNGAALLAGVTVNGDITLASGADMHLRPGTTYRLQHQLTSTGGTLHGDFTTASGAAITLNTSSTSTAGLTVSGTLTLTSSLTQGSLSAGGSWSTGSTYTLIKANRLYDQSGKSLYTLFNLSESGYTITNTGSAVTLKKKAAVSTALQRMAATAAPAMAADDEGSLIIIGAPEIQLTETAVDGVADAMVQADWGVVHAQRAFSGTLNAAHGNLRALGNGRTAVWANTFGGTTRLSSNRDHAGADHQLMGASLGFETAVGGHGAAGIGIGHTWNRVNTFGMSRLRQDTQHAGAFGRARLASSGGNTLWIEGTAAYGKTESRGQLGYSRERWTQNSGSLSARVNDVLQLTDSTAVNFYGGLEYLATDNGRIDDLRTGSVQDLRGEIGAGITHRAGDAVVYAEAALQGDMVRHNPQADVGIRRHGANPGRIGGSISVGGAYSLGEHWSVNAAYTFEGVKHSNSHNANVGATFRF